MNSNVHRAAHYLSDHATANFEAARADLAAFINAAREEVITKKGTTEGINLVAQCLGRERLKAGDEILITALSTTPISCPGSRCASAPAPFFR